MNRVGLGFRTFVRLLFANSNGLIVTFIMDGNSRLIVLLPRGDNLPSCARRHSMNNGLQEKALLDALDLAEIDHSC